jgi:hypothetical protein
VAVAVMQVAEQVVALAALHQPHPQVEPNSLELRSFDNAFENSWLIFICWFGYNQLNCLWRWNYNHSRSWQGKISIIGNFCA